MEKKNSKILFKKPMSSKKSDLKTLQILERKVSEIKRKNKWIRLKPHSLITPLVGLSNMDSWGYVSIRR